MELKHARYRDILLWSALAIAFILCYYPTFQWLHFKYSGAESYFSHGYLIPFISAYLLYLKKDELARTEIGSSASGLFVILPPLSIHVFGVLGYINFISAFSMILFLAGCSLYLLGRAVTRIVAFPLSYLVFMCPIPDNIINFIALPSKSIATTIALKIISGIGIPYVQEGFRIMLIHSTYIVGAPCNGMRSIISFLALGILFIYLTKASFLKKMIFLAAIPPVAIVLNGVRIALLLLIAHKYGQEAASPESYLHDASGIVVFVIGLVLMIMANRFMYEKKRL